MAQSKEKDAFIKIADILLVFLAFFDREVFWEFR